MRIPFATTATRVLFSVLLASATLLTTACKDEKEPVVTPPQDFTATDDAIIQKYLTDNAITTARKLPSGLYYLPIRTNPNGYQPVVTNVVYVQYTGYLINGTVFDATSLRNNTPFSFTLGAGRVIRGWDEGVALMRKGEISELLIPSAMAYGNNSPTSAIPPNSVLRFRIELVDVR